MFEDSLGLQHLCDARLRTEDGFEFPVHRVVLALKSEYFRDLLTNAASEDKDILIPGIQGSTMEIVLNYIYTGKIDVDGRDIRDILVAAYYLRIENLLMCSRNLAIRSLTTTNCIPLFLAAYRIEKLGVLKACNRFIVANFQAVVRDDNSRFQDLPVECLETFLSLDTLNASSENRVWEAIVLWIGKTWEKRKYYLKNLISQIRCDETDVELRSEILEHPLVKESTSCDEIKEMINLSPIPKPRIPEKFFIFTKSYINRADYSEGIRVYMTFDDHIDLWRNIGSKICSPDVILHGCGSLVVMFETSINVICSFDVVSKTWSTLPVPAISRSEYNVVKLGGNIFILGGITPDDFDETTDVAESIITEVERFNFETERWELASSSFAYFDESAVAINGNICIIGTVTEHFNDFLAAQVYNPDTDTWRSISAPDIFRRQFALVVYQDRLLILGGHSDTGLLKSVEEYNVEQDRWRQLTELPFTYYLPKAIVVENVLYVYDNNPDDVHDVRCPPVFWDEAGRKWEVVGASSPFCDLHIYQFCTIEDSYVIAELRRENTDAYTKWEESPFFAYLNAQDAV